MSNFVNLGADDPLHRAVVISLFTWARASDSDPVDDGELHGYWGDSFPDTAGDRIGSKLWLLRRRTLTDATVRDALSYARDALVWMTADEVVDRVDVLAERKGADRINMRVVLSADGVDYAVNFDDLWRVINNAV